MNIYLIGCLRNPKIPFLANELRLLGYEVFDDWFAPGKDADAKLWEYERSRGHSYKQALRGFAAQHVFEFDMVHLRNADVGLLALPAGKSCHLELGWLIGRGVPSYVLFDKEPARFDVMYQFANDVFFSKEELFDFITTHHPVLRAS